MESARDILALGTAGVAVVGAWVYQKFSVQQIKKDVEELESRAGRIDDRVTILANDNVRSQERLSNMIALQQETRSDMKAVLAMIVELKVALKDK